MMANRSLNGLPCYGYIKLTLVHFVLAIETNDSHESSSVRLMVNLWFDVCLWVKSTRYHGLSVINTASPQNIHSIH